MVDLHLVENWDHRVSTGVWVVFFDVKALEKEARSFFIPSLSAWSLSFGKDVRVHKNGGVVVADAWYWFASADY